MDFSLLSWPAHINCAVDTRAKQALYDAVAAGIPLAFQRFLLEPIVCYVGGEKMTPDTEDLVHVWAHQQLAREAFLDSKTLTSNQFDTVAWKAV